MHHWISPARLCLCIFTILTLGGTAQAHPRVEEEGCFRDNETTALFQKLGKNALWQQVGRVPMEFTTFHTQGMLKVDDLFFVSAVEVIESTERNGSSTDALFDFGTDRSVGKGRGFLFKFNSAGELLGQIEVSDGSIYHPGGIDYDGAHIWLPVAEYRPNSRSHVYRVDPKTLSVEMVLSVDDHIGGVVFNRHKGALHGVSWGSRRLYTWKPKRAGGFHHPTWVPNTAAYVDYQDCHYQGVEYMLCGGVGGYDTPMGRIAFGGLELVDLRDNRPAHQIPVNHFVDDGAGIDPTLSLSHNAFWVEPTSDDTMRMYFMTEKDNQADLIIYDVKRVASTTRQ